MKTVLGIDLGTQSLKVLAYNYEDRAVIAASAAPLDIDQDDSGRAEQDARWWLDGLAAAVRDLPKEVRDSIEAIGVSGQQHGFVPLDAEGNVLAPVKLWCDTSTQAEVEEITKACGGVDACIKFAGNPMLTGYTAPKILWLKKHLPVRYRKMVHILLPHDYLNFVLTGALAMELGDASGTGMLDVRSRRWSPQMLHALDDERDLAQCLPPLVACDGMIGATTDEISKILGLPSGIPVAPGGGDNMMAAIGTGNVAPGTLTMSLGTSGTLFANSDSPVIDDAGNIAAFCNSTGGWLPLLCTLNCTSATELMRRLTDVSIDDFDQVIGSVRAGADGLIVLPLFAGERTPNLPNARGEVHGLSAHNCSKAHFLRATVEGVSYSLRFGLDELRRLGINATQIVLTGGGARSRVWRKIISNVCHLPVVTPLNDEGACFGAALQALWLFERANNAALTPADLTNVHVKFDIESRVAPNAEDVKIYEESYAAYRNAISRVRQ